MHTANTLSARGMSIPVQVADDLMHLPAITVDVALLHGCNG